MGRAQSTQGVVKACVRTHDGSWLIITRNKLSGSSPVEIPEGRTITIRDGIVEAGR